MNDVIAARALHVRAVVIGSVVFYRESRGSDIAPNADLVSGLPDPGLEQISNYRAASPPPMMPRRGRESRVPAV
jgi:hypothetical protein